MQIHKKYMNGFVALRDLEIVILYRNVQMSWGYSNKMRSWCTFIEILVGKSKIMYKCVIAKFILYDLPKK